MRGVGGYIVIWWPGDRPGFDVAELARVAPFPWPRLADRCGRRRRSGVVRRAGRVHRRPPRGERRDGSRAFRPSSRTGRRVRAATTRRWRSPAGSPGRPRRGWCPRRRRSGRWRPGGPRSPRSRRRDKKGEPKHGRLGIREVRSIECWAIGQAHARADRGGEDEGGGERRRLARRAGRRGGEVARGLWSAARCRPRHRGGPVIGRVARRVPTVAGRRLRPRRPGTPRWPSPRPSSSTATPPGCSSIGGLRQREDRDRAGAGRRRRARHLHHRLRGRAAVGDPRRERTKQATGGLLRKIGDRGVLVIKDVTSILSADRNMPRRGAGRDPRDL